MNWRLAAVLVHCSMCSACDSHSSLLSTWNSFMFAHFLSYSPSGLGSVGIQFGCFAHLTWFEYSWHIMELVTYFATYGTLILFYCYFLLTRQEYTYPDAQEHIQLFRLHKAAMKKTEKWVWGGHHLCEYMYLYLHLRMCIDDPHPVSAILSCSCSLYIPNV